MNGLIASLALPRRQALRGLIIAALCASAVLLVGAVRQRQLNPPHTSQSNETLGVASDPAADGVLASYNTAPENRELLFDKPIDSVSFATEKVEPIPAAAEPAAAPLADRLTLPTLAPRVRVMKMEVTAYCPCTKCCGPKAQGITASGKRVSYNGGRFVAADTRLLKFHTKLIIPGYADNQPVPVIDRGGAIKGNKLDVYFPSHQTARQWGRRKIDVLVIEE
jgi:3D (Asp-Asp-Asp) domain-containing protein